MTSTSSSELGSAITVSRSMPAALNSSTIAGSRSRSVDARGDLERFEITALVGGGADALDDLADPGRIEIEPVHQ